MNSYCKDCVYINSERCKKCMKFDEIPSQYKNINKHLKGYLYDSLVYRYKYALELGLEDRTFLIYKQKKMHNIDEARVEARILNERDVLKFCDILDEVIGEHD